jgi:hypothetical protein
MSKTAGHGENLKTPTNKAEGRGVEGAAAAPSGEQEAIIECVNKGKSCVGDAVAGSGKTTTVLWLAKSTDKRIMQITYNKLLKEEVRASVKREQLKNISIDNYHSIATTYYNHMAHKNDELKRVVEMDMPPKREIPLIDILVLDEVQDMTALFYRLIRKFITDMMKKEACKGFPTMLFLGDHYQGINEFLGADTRFLTLVPQIWPMLFPIMKMPLKTSYRVTRQIARFVNECVLGYDRIIAVKDGPPVTYIRNVMYGMHYPVGNEIIKLISSGVKPEEIFVLARSVNSRLIVPLENYLVSAQIPIHVTKTKDEKSNAVINGKLLITTLNQSKGRERPYVFVLGFDKSFYMNSDQPVNECPAVLYVALTRALTHLYVCQDHKSGEMPFLKHSIEEMKRLDYVDVQDRFPGSIDGRGDKTVQRSGIHKTTPTKLIEYLRDNIINEVTPLVNHITKVVKEAVHGRIVDMPSVVNGVNEDLALTLSEVTINDTTNDTTNDTINGDTGVPSNSAKGRGGVELATPSTSEHVGDIVGLAVPCMYEVKTSGTCTIQEELMRRIERGYKGNPTIDFHIKNLNLPCKSTADYLYMCNVYSALSDGLLFRIEQLTNYEWLDQESVDGCHWHMHNELLEPDNMTYEIELLIDSESVNTFILDNFGDTIGRVQIAARIDAIDNSTVWEFKCVSEITIDHKLQAIIYAWLWRYGPGEMYGKRMFKIFNVRSGEVVLINHTSPIIDEIVAKLLWNKYGRDTRLEDGQFIENLDV